MALSLLYLGFVRILQLFRLVHRYKEELAFEVVMLRHEVTVLRRQVTPPGLATRESGAVSWLSRAPGKALRSAG
jgi:hypothetical protein